MRPHELEDLLAQLALQPHGILEAVLRHAMGFSQESIDEAVAHGVAKAEAEPLANKLSAPVRRLFITPMGEQLLKIDASAL